MWKCRKCGRSFRNENQSHFCGKAPETVDEYISEQDAGIQEQLQLVRKAIRDELPEAKEKISWAMPTWWNGHNIIHFAAQKTHIGLYPGPEAVACFAERLDEYGLRYSKGSIQIPYSDELPLPTGHSIADSKELIQMNSLEIRNRKIIDAVIRKEQAVCPGAIALIGIYGSFQTGDIHPLSDLDLLILINDDRGWQLGKAFIQEDLGVGHDIYCTTRESLRQDAEYDHPHISKLMDAQIVYCADEKYRIELETLREQVRKKLAEPFGEEDYRKAEKELKEARCCYADAMTAEALNDARRSAGGVIFFAENALALLNKTYFCKGVSRRREELDAMERKPDHLCGMIENVLAATTVEDLKEQLTQLMKGLDFCFRQVKGQLPRKKKPAGADTLSGTYEEMFSNWHGKMAQAAEKGDRHLAFMSLESLNEMLNDISSEVDIGTYDVLSAYDPGDLRKTADGFDRILRQYLKEYEKAGLRPARYADVDEFAAEYMRNCGE